ncbi:MAG: rRNA maturation RNase YbeY [Calditrichia bacterium]|nr:rRNA maturation RNase YbeY [Calditrichia bacterium]
MSKRFIEYHWDFDGKEIVDKNIFSNITRDILKELDLSFDHLALIFVNDDYLKDLHGKYLNDLSVTDVMTFDLRDEDSLDAEIYISVDTATRVANDLKITIEEEILRYVIHGILHLAGYDDQKEDDRTKMKKVENVMVEKYSEKMK